MTYELTVIGRGNLPEPLATVRNCWVAIGLAALYSRSGWTVAVNGQPVPREVWLSCVRVWHIA